MIWMLILLLDSIQFDNRVFNWFLHNFQFTWFLWFVIGLVYCFWVNDKAMNNKWIVVTESIISK